MESVIEKYAPRFIVLSGVSLTIVLMAWLGILLRTIERAQHPNLLSQSPECYLQACQYQLVNWQPWDEASLARAKELDRLVFVEVGTFWSGYCKRLGQELFQDSGVADLLNREYVPIKVDAESAPKRARYLLQIAELLNAPARYPLVVVFTPDGKPITAQAPETRAELMRLLESTSRTYQNAPEEIRVRAEMLERAWIDRWVRSANPRPLTFDRWESIRLTLSGLSLAPTERHWLNWMEWLSARAQGGDRDAQETLVSQLQALRQSRLWDAQDGGFFALAEGLTPEGEPRGAKRLIEQARLLRLYLLASKYEPELMQTARELVGFLRRTLWQERPPGFRNSTQPPRVLTAIAREAGTRPLSATLSADANAYALIALVDYIEAVGTDDALANWARQAVVRTMETLRALRTTQGDLYHTSRRQTSGWLPDLALVAYASLRLQRIEPTERNLQFARSLLRIIREKYSDPTGGLYDVAIAKRWHDWTLQPVRATADEFLPADDMLVVMALLESGRPDDIEYAEQLLQVVLGDYDPNRPERFLGLGMLLETHFQNFTIERATSDE